MPTHRIPIIVAALVALGCSDSSSPIPVASVAVVPAVDTVRAGETVTLVATPRDASGNALTGRSVDWASSNIAVATVNAGVVTGVSAGTATISATSGGQSGSAAVTVWVGITGNWAGTVDAPVGLCPLNLSITEDDNGDITGSAELLAPCGANTFTMTGTNNTGGVADSVELTFGTPAPNFDFNGNFDGSGTMDGLINGAGCVDCPTSFTRNSITPISGLTAVRRGGATVGDDPFRRRN